MIKDKNIEKMLEIINQITKEIPEHHQSHIFWCPKTNSDAGRVDGFILYAYGGYVLKIFIKEGRLAYETNYHKYKENYFHSSISLCCCTISNNFFVILFYFEQ